MMMVSRIVGRVMIGESYKWMRVRVKDGCEGQG